MGQKISIQNFKLQYKYQKLLAFQKQKELLKIPEKKAYFPPKIQRALLSLTVAFISGREDRLHTSSKGKLLPG